MEFTKNPLNIAMKGNAKLEQVTSQEYRDLMAYEDRHLMTESVTLEELEATFMYDAEILPVDSQLLEAISSTKQRLPRTMKAFIRTLNKKLNGTGIRAGSDDAGGASKDGSIDIGGANIGRARNINGLPVLPAVIPMSDGQSVSVLFHSPTAEGKITPADTLVAFMFMLNKKDVTHTVSPIQGQDLTLEQVAMKLANLVELNTAKFQRAQKKKNSVIDEINQLQADSDKKEGDIQTVSDHLQEVQANYAADQKTIADIQAQAQVIEQENTELQSQIDELKKTGGRDTSTPLTPQPDPQPEPQPEPEPEPTPPVASKNATEIADPSIYWYGMKARVGGPTDSEYQPVGTISQEEALTLPGFSENGFNEADVRNGAIGYRKPLSGADIASYELVELNQASPQVAAQAAIKAAITPALSGYTGTSQDFAKQLVTGDTEFFKTIDGQDKLSMRSLLKDAGYLGGQKGAKALYALIDDILSQAVVPTTSDKPTASGSLYSSVVPDLRSANAIVKAVADAGVTGGVPADELHVTVVYSQNNGVNIQPDPDRDYKASFTGEIGVLGNAVVAFLSSPDLQTRHDELLGAGAQHSFPDYLPHLSLKYNPSAEDVKSLQASGIPLSTMTLSLETFSAIDPDSSGSEGGSGTSNDVVEPDNGTGEDDQMTEADIEANKAIEYLKTVISMESSDMVEIRNARGQVRQAIASLQAAGRFEENEDLVNDAAQRLSDLLVAIQKAGS